MFLHTVLASGPGEPCRTITKQGRSLSTPTFIEAHAVAAHRCIVRAYTWTDGVVGEKRQNKCVSEVKTPGCFHEVSNTDLILSKTYQQPANCCLKKDFDSPPFTLTNERGIYHLAWSRETDFWQA